MTPLSERQIDVVRCMSEGLQNKQIARRLNIELGTVKCHAKEAMLKLRAANRTQAVAIAVRAGII